MGVTVTTIGCRNGGLVVLERLSGGRGVRLCRAWVTASTGRWPRTAPYGPRTLGWDPAQGLALLAAADVLRVARCLGYAGGDRDGAMGFLAPTEAPRVLLYDEGGGMEFAS